MESEARRSFAFAFFSGHQECLRAIRDFEYVVDLGLSRTPVRQIQLDVTTLDRKSKD